MLPSAGGAKWQPTGQEEPQTSTWRSLCARRHSECFTYMNSFNPCTTPLARAPSPRGNQICEHRFHSRGSSESHLGEKPKERARSLPSSARERPSQPGQREVSSVGCVGELSEEPPSPTTVPGLLRSLLSTHQVWHKQGVSWKKDTRTLDKKRHLVGTSVWPMPSRHILCPSCVVAPSVTDVVTWSSSWTCSAEATALTTLVEDGLGVSQSRELGSKGKSAILGTGRLGKCENRMLRPCLCPLHLLECWPPGPRPLWGT